ncbi:MAG: hypothetical protein HYX44_05835 [Aquabacterium sp.]|nr:hypothetical protein [Aquabacterium sp.]
MPPPYDRTHLPTLAEWKAATALNVLHVRSTALKLVDDAIAACEGQHPPSDSALRRLKATFELWKATKEGQDHWRTSERNHSLMLTRLDEILSGQADTDLALGSPAFMEDALVHARLGVLYLLAHVDCQDTAFRVVLDGAVGFGTDAALKFANRPVDVDTGPLSGIAAKFSKPAAQSVARPAGPLALQSDQLMVREWGRFTSLSKGLHDAQGLDAWASVTEDVTMVCDAVARIVVGNGFSPLGTTVEITKGLYLAGTAAVAKYTEWRRSQGVELLAGYPSTVQEAIRKAMWMSIGHGVYETLKGGLKLGLELAAGAVADAVALIASAIEAVIKCILRILDLRRIKTCLSEAKNHWHAYMQDQQAKQDKLYNGIHKRPIEFNQWFRPYALAVPSLAVLVLNSGVCQDSMHFLKMFDGQNMAISQSAYDAGLAYIDELKLDGVRLLEEQGFAFSSGDPLVQSCLEGCAHPGLALLSPRSPLKTILDTVASS